MAREAGIPDAVVLRFLSYKVTRSKNLRDGQRWFFDSIPKIARRFPYLTPAAVEEVLRRNALAGRLVRGNYNRQRRDRTIWYSMSPEVMNQAEKDLVGFQVADACAFDLPTAVLLCHLGYWAGRSLADNPDSQGRFRLSPTEAARFLPLSKASVERKLADLQSAGVLERCGKEANVAIYAFGGPWAERVKPIIAPQRGTAPPKRAARATSSAVTNSSGRRSGHSEDSQATEVSPATVAVSQSQAPKRERITRLVAQNDQYLDSLSLVEQAGIRGESQQFAGKILGVFTTKQLIQQYRMMPSSDEFLARLQ